VGETKMSKSKILSAKHIPKKQRTPTVDVNHDLLPEPDMEVYLDAHEMKERAIADANEAFEKIR
jgi:hypothetical protein